MISKIAASRFPISLSVILPCYNEEHNVWRVVSRAREVLKDPVEEWETIIINDGSADATGALADALAAENRRIRVVHHPVNEGYGCALRSGYSAATKDYVFYTDGDGQYDIKELTLLLSQRHKAHVINGYRHKRRESWLRCFNGACWSWLCQRFLRFQCRDVVSAFKLYRREIFDHFLLKSRGAAIDAEVLARITWAKFFIHEVPVTHLPHLAGVPTGARPRIILNAFRELFALRRDM